LNIHRYLPPSQLHLICGRSGVGKTHFLFQFLDRFRSDLGKILYLATDRSKDAYQGIFTKGNIAEWPLFSKISLGADELGSAKDYGKEISKKLDGIENRKECFRWLDSMVVAHKPDTVVVDVAQRFIPCANLNNSASVHSGMGFVASWAVYHGLMLILVWHPNKQLKEKLNDPFDLIAHSHVVQGMTSTKAILEQANGGNYTLTVRGPTFEDEVVSFTKNEHGFFQLESEDSKIGDLFPIYNHVGNEPTRLEAIIDAAERDQKCAACSKTSVKIQLAKLIEAKMIEKPRHGFYKKRIIS